MEDKTTRKEMYNPDKTIAAFDKIISDFKKAQRIVGVIAPLVMILYLIYAAITSLNVLYLHIIYSITLCLLIIEFIVLRIFIVRDYKNKEVKKKTRRSFKYIKHLLKIFAAGFAIYEMLSFEISALKTVFTLIAVCSVIINAIIDIVTAILDHYIKIIKEGLVWDWQEFQQSGLYKSIDVMKNLPATGLNLINKGLTKVVSIKNGREEIDVVKENISIKPNKIRETIEKQAVIVDEKRILKKELKKQKKEEKKQIKRDRLNSEKSKFIKNISDIFKQKKKM